MKTTHYVVLTLLLVYALVFVLLSIDVMARIWDWRARFETPVDVAALLFFDGLRSVVMLAGIATSAFAVRRARSAAALVWLAYACVLATVAYAKVTAFGGFPGAVQERVAVALIGAGTPRWLLQLVFGHWQWVAWLALGALVLLTRSWPHRLTAADVQASGGSDRTGAMRSVALAGADVGSLTRGWTASLAAAGWLDASRVWLLATSAAAAHTLALFTLTGAAAIAANATAALLAGMMTAVAVTLFRAGRHAAGERGTPFLRWLERAAQAGLLLFAIAAGLDVLGLPAFLSTSAMLLAPGAAFFCAARAAAATP